MEKVKRVFHPAAGANRSPHTVRVKGKCVRTGDEHYYHSIGQAELDGWCRKGIRKCLRGEQIQSNGMFWAAWDGVEHE